jgi:fucose permease
MVALGSLAGLGAGAIDAGLNTYVATHHSARTLNLLHAFYGLGTTTGPVIMTSVLMAGFGWQKGYALVGTAQLVLAACFAATGSLWPRSGTAAAPGGRAREPLPAPILGTLGLRAAQLGITAFFVYVGLEATAGAWIFSLLTGARGVSMEMSGAAASLYWGGLMSGRLVFALIPGLKPRTLMGSGIAGSVLASIALLLGIGPEADVAAAALLGFACGPIFPVLIATTPERLGVTHTANGVGFQVAAAAMGQSLLPAFTGVLAGRVGLEAVPAALLFLSLLLMVVFIFLEAGSPARVAPIRTMASDRATMTERPQRLPDQHRGRSSPGLRSGRAA